LIDVLYGGVVDPANKNSTHTQIVDLVSPGQRVLEVGPGSGVICGYLTAHKGCTVTAVEINLQAAALAAAQCRRVITGSIEDEAVVRQAAAGGPFDAIVCADVLEHLADPWAVLRRLRNLLAPGGAVLASLPNVAHWSVRFRLLFGQFEYADGLLRDRTHLRFFTLASARRLFHDCGYRLTYEHVCWVALPPDRLWRLLPPLRRLVNSTLVRLWPGLHGHQFVFRAVPTGEAA